MYKQALGIKDAWRRHFMMFGHLDLDGEHYLECCDGRSLPDYEIVQYRCEI